MEIRARHCDSSARVASVATLQGENPNASWDDVVAVWRKNKKEGKKRKMNDHVLASAGA